jgi:hypothetical protein
MKMKKGLVVITFVVLLIGSVRAATSLQVPVDGDLWTESSSYASCWSSGNGGTISYVTTDVNVGSYAVQDYKAANGYYVGPTFFFSGAPLDLSAVGTGISFGIYAHVTNDLAWLNNGNMIQMEWRIYTVGGYFSAIANSPKGLWATADSLQLSNFTNTSGTPDWTKVTGVGFYNLYSYADATTIKIDGLHFDNVTINPGATSGFPTLLMRSPSAGTNGVFTNAQGIGSVDLRWSERVHFDATDISVVDEHGSNVYTTVSGIDSDLMRISFLPPLLNNKCTVTIFDSVVSLERAVAIDGDANGVSGGNTVFVMEHRQKEDMNKDNQVNLGDLEIFANNWLEQF